MDLEDRIRFERIYITSRLLILSTSSHRRVSNAPRHVGPASHVEFQTIHTFILYTCCIELANGGLVVISEALKDIGMNGKLYLVLRQEL
ncbi:hypothetical protein VNO78_05605 [Psophocarpus tetragonolobus]|uniref:Uncharacterized protein n=1 Tax=Psophocarpus tetragonolobus TaxID=3891 RepID=A0AAN9XQV6_PSOTE